MSSPEVDDPTSHSGGGDAPTPASDGGERPSLPRVEPFFPVDETRDATPEPPRLDMARWPKGPELRSEPSPKPRRRFDPLALAASLASAGLVALGLFAAYDHMRERALLAAKTHENQDIAKSVAALKTRLDAFEAQRTQDPAAEFRKSLAEIKAATAAPAALAQRVDRLEKDDSRLEKLDQTTANRYAEIVARLEKLEKKTTTVALVQPAPAFRAAVANDVTGSIDKPKPVLRAYTLDDVRGGVAYLEGRDGNYDVEPGDTLPGAGKVLKIERRGQGWVVVTSQGLITAAD